MDLYRYFHPHYNPRLRGVGVRLQELGELEQAAVELCKALERAEIRSEINPVDKVNKERFSEIVHALDFVVNSLRDLTKAHPGDSLEEMHAMLKERSKYPGWENWSRLLKQRLRLIRDSEGREITHFDTQTLLAEEEV